jgi:hypothetical protein
MIAVFYNVCTSTELFLHASCYYKKNVEVSDLISLTVTCIWALCNISGISNCSDNYPHPKDHNLSRLSSLFLLASFLTILFYYSLFVAATLNAWNICMGCVKVVTSRSPQYEPGRTRREFLKEKISGVSMRAALLPVGDSTNSEVVIYLFTIRLEVSDYRLS